MLKSVHIFNFLFDKRPREYVYKDGSTVVTGAALLVVHKMTARVEAIDPGVRCISSVNGFKKCNIQ